MLISSGLSIRDSCSTLTAVIGVQGQDLVSGNLTAPAVFALQHPQYGAELEGLIQNEFDGGSSFARALDLVHLGGGIQAARHLARQEADMVSACLLAMLPDPSATTEQPCTMGAWDALNAAQGVRSAHCCTLLMEARTVELLFWHCQYLTRDAALAGFGCVAVPAGLASKEVSRDDGRLCSGPSLLILTECDF